MIGRIYNNGSVVTEQYGNIVELVFPDGRMVQLACSGGYEPNNVNLRIFPSDGEGGFSRMTVMSMSIMINPDSKGGVEIRDMRTSHTEIYAVMCEYCQRDIPGEVLKARQLLHTINVCSERCKARVEARCR